MSFPGGNLEDQRYYYEMLYVIFVACLIAIGTLTLTSLMLLYQKTVSSFVKNGVYLTFLIVMLITGFVATLYWPLRDEIIQLGTGDQIIGGDSGPINFRRSLQGLFCRSLEVKTNDTHWDGGGLRVWIVATAPNIDERNITYRIRLSTDGKPITIRLNANDRFRFQSQQMNATVLVFQGTDAYHQWLQYHHHQVHYTDIDSQHIWRKTNLYGGTDYINVDSSNVYVIVATRNAYKSSVPYQSKGEEANHGVIEVDRFRYTPTHCDPMVCANLAVGRCKKKELLTRYIIDNKVERYDDGETKFIYNHRLSHVKIHCHVDYVLMICLFSVIPLAIIFFTIASWVRQVARKNSISTTSLVSETRQPTCAFDNRCFTNYT